MKDKVLNDFVKLVEDIDLKYTKIFFVHPLDLINMNMGDIADDTIYISNIDVKRGNIYLVQDEELRKQLYTFAKQFPDRVSRGGKNNEQNKNFSSIYVCCLYIR